jgi:arylsulfatase A-like enzyme
MITTRTSLFAVAIAVALIGAPVAAATADPSRAELGTAVAAHDVQRRTDVPPATVEAHGWDGGATTSSHDTAAGPAAGNPSSAALPGLTLPGNRPNIIVFYLDDTSPAQGLLWNSAVRTPTINDLFVKHGISFPNAIGETPFCCPGRAGLLTGLHTRNHGVTYNDARLFKPREHIGHALRESGYDTFMIGKYYNLADKLSSADWSRHSAGWTQMDVFRKAGTSSANYFDYTLFTKQGPVRYGRYHSTRMIADRAVLHMREAEPTTPVFMLLSMYDTHAPNLPMPEYVGDARCRDMPRWKPPNYNEADVSDKPAHVRARPRLPSAAGWSMTAYCEEMLGVDWLVKRVTDELAAQGRLDNTLLVFTADNGMTWGQHRLGQIKETPYATPVPLYMHWPARWGSDAQTIDDIVVNIDLAPTFCALGGCTLGPYPGGQLAPDGVSLLPLLDGAAADLGRDAVLEQQFTGRQTSGATFSALRTTPSNPLGRWHYVEYDDGFRELYNLASDPWELQNLAYSAASASLRRALALRLAELRREGRPGGGGTYARPDGLIALSSTGTYVGKNRYADTPIAGQTRKRAGVARNATYEYSVRIRNGGSSAGAFSVYGEAFGTPTMFARYFAGAKDVTAAVTAGSYTTASLAPGAMVTLTVRVHVSSTAPVGARKTALVRIASVASSGLVDVVRAITIR